MFFEKFVLRFYVNCDILYIKLEYSLMYDAVGFFLILSEGDCRYDSQIRKELHKLITGNVAPV